MAITSSVGAGSGLDISGLVTQLVEAERASRSAPINRRESKAKAQISAFGTIKSAFDKLKTSLDALKPGALFTGRTITTSSADHVAVKAASGSTASVGSLDVVVDRLASAHKIRFTEQPAETELAAGTLRFTYGSGPDANFDIEITEDNNSLRKLAAAINDKNTGLTASVVSSASGESLVLTAKATGADSTISITQTAGAGDLSAFETANAANFTELAEAQDARAYIDGVLVTSATNTLSDAVEGLELTLKKVTDGSNNGPTQATITVGENLAPARSAIEALVKAYNEANDALRAQTAYNADTNTASTLTGDPLARSTGDQIRRALGELIGEAGANGIDLGLSTDLNGKLSFNTSKFDAAIAANPEGVRNLLSGDNSALQRRLGTPVGNLLSSNGSFAKRTESLESTVAQAATQRTDMERRLSQIEERYRKQFIALDTLLGKLASTSNYLSQQLASLPGAAS